MKILNRKNIILLAGVFVSAILFFRLHSKNVESEIKSTSGDYIEIIRTKGGLLQVSSIKSLEIFQETKQHKFFGISLGKTITQIKVPAVFNYYIDLAPIWKIRVHDKMIIVVAPSIKPMFPVAIDTSALEGFSSGGWSFITGDHQLKLLQKSITQELGFRALTPSKIQLQREMARKTVEEFVDKWLLTQAKWVGNRSSSIKVYFEDESIGSINYVSS